MTSMGENAPEAPQTRIPTKEVLINLSEALGECIRECENYQFHHSPEGTVEQVHYTLLAVTKEKLDAQIEKYPRIQPSVASTHELV